MSIERVADRWLVTGAVLSILIGLLQSGRLCLIQSQARKAALAPALSRGDLRFPPGTDHWVLEGAIKSGVGQVSSVETRGTAREQLRVEWSGGSPASIRLLAMAESRGARVERVQVRASARGVMWALTAVPSGPRAIKAPSDFSRDPLLPVMPSSSRVPEKARVSHRRERARKDQEERDRATMAAAAETQRLDQRRREIIDGVRLSATMSSGREPLALAEVAEDGRRRTVTLHRGDSILGALVAGIDDRAGTVEVDIEGKTRVLLRMAGAPTP